MKETCPAPRSCMRERFLAAMSGQTDAGLVFVPDLSYWLTAHPQPGPDTDETYAQFHRHLGVMAYYRYGVCLCWPQLRGVEINTESAHGVTLTTWHTPRGPLHKQVTSLPGSHTEAVTRYPVQNRTDLERLIAAYKLAEIVSAPREPYEQRMKVMRELDGYPIVPLPRSPVPALITDWAGVMNAVLLMEDAPDLCREFFSLAEALCRQAVEIVADVAPPVVHVCDNLASDIYTPYYESLMAPYYRFALERLHRAGIKVATHLDGLVAGLLPRLAQSGFDAVEALTPAPVGDISAARMRELAGPDVVLWGGIPGAMFAPPWTWSALEAHVREVLDAWHGTPFVLGIADQLPPDGRLEFVAEIAEITNG